MNLGQKFFDIIGLLNHIFFRWRLLMGLKAPVSLEGQQFLLILGGALKEILVI